MTINSQLSDSKDSVLISVDGRFDFSSHRDFREAYESYGTEIKRYEIDMAKTVYLDSSALGMLLLLRDYAGGNDATIRIVNCSEAVRNIFSISNFEQLFEIS